MHATVSSHDLRRSIRSLEEMAALCSYGPDKRRFLAQVEELRGRLTAEPRDFRPAGTAERERAVAI